MTNFSIQYIIPFTFLPVARNRKVIESFSPGGTLLRMSVSFLVINNATLARIVSKDSLSSR